MTGHNHIRLGTRLAIALIACSVMATSCLFSVKGGGTGEAIKTAAAAAPVKKAHDTISISIVGDLMVGSSYPAAMYLPPAGEQSLFTAALPYLAQTDLRIGNLESAVADSAPVYKDCNGNMCYFFRTPLKYAQWYKTAGFDYLNLANNHSFDFGMAGVTSTLAFLAGNQIRCSGILQHPFDTLTIRGTRIGFVSFAPHTNCLDLNNDSLVAACISQLRPMCGLVVVFFHGGGEGGDKLHTPNEHEIFLEQDRGWVRHFCHLCIDNGADLVVGSGPHVVRGMELYRGKLAAYSLGNFATYHLFNLKTPRNIAPLLQVSITDKGVLAGSKIISFVQEGEGVPVQDSTMQAYKLIRSLSEDDFGFTDVHPG